MIDWSRIEGFDWDEGNRRKILLKHNVSVPEVEQAFGNEPIFVWPDFLHSVEEERFQMMGRADEGRRLFIVFTLRQDGSRVRVISARDMSVKERQAYGR